MSIALSSDSVDFSSKAFGDTSVNFFIVPGACPSSAKISPAFKALLPEFSTTFSSTVIFSSIVTLSRNCPPIGDTGAPHRKRECGPK
ncbi:hypothetical protein [Methanosarcina sp. UBA411]|jgi:hypothetical protein|uniref:hypothetical protein n=1 Tax=Methanosarcina sp. UBA411 TaxID=1915589 RepID=UPI0025DDC04E|nr:hypothetical protein [Methanosarcina sp. UBA411]